MFPGSCHRQLTALYPATVKVAEHLAAGNRSACVLCMCAQDCARSFAWCAVSKLQLEVCFVVTAHWHAVQNQARSTVAGCCPSRLLSKPLRGCWQEFQRAGTCSPTETAADTSPTATARWAMHRAESLRACQRVLGVTCLAAKLQGPCWCCLILSEALTDQRAAIHAKARKPH